MPDPVELLAAARLLTSGSLPLSNARLRRAVSTAYYAVFHKVLRTAAARFMGAGQESSAGYQILYRSFEHARLLKVCEALDKPTMTSEYQRALKRPSVSQSMRNFARVFAVLQTERHLADYDPGYRLAWSTAADIITMADFAIGSFDAASSAEQADVMALMMVKSRT